LLGCDTLVIITGVERVAVHFKKPEQRDLTETTAEELERYYKEGHFPAGNMGPKVQAAIEFLRGGGGEVVITSPEKTREALEGAAGTRVRRG
jgi:carbamate kinase